MDRGRAGATRTDEGRRNFADDPDFARSEGHEEDVPHATGAKV